MRSYEEKISDEAVVAKVLRSLTPKFDHVVVAIEESKDLSIFSFDELMGSLQAHESRINRSLEKNKEKAFQVKETFTNTAEAQSHIEESQKGQTVQGLHQFKLYLKKFGYLNYDPSNKNSRANDDEFDELLESALKQYQANYNLKVTGKLDSATIKEMMLPRCGVADVVKGKNSIPTHKKRKHGIHTVSHYKFTNGMPKWDASKRRLTYRFKSAVQVVGLDDLRSACASAFKRWQDVSVFTFEEAPEGSAGAEIEIGFYRGDHGDGFNFDGKFRILAHAFPPENGHFHYDADENFLDTSIHMELSRGICNLTIFKGYKPCTLKTGRW
ncbi:hypothetical protein RJ639_021440 [Escallonia herrerae]|uniref:Peptidase metallopeptidase domain-containing protein n=1 Tax=Escallonia herrerae TaxID=1293975 RepID=A0AA88V821_9ASTE|nr:hypothetical protein RJ639_021440 [Escallonia herrerae]